MNHASKVSFFVLFVSCMPAACRRLPNTADLPQAMDHPMPNEDREVTSLSLRAQKHTSNASMLEESSVNAKSIGHSSTNFDLELMSPMKAKKPCGGTLVERCGQVNRTAVRCDKFFKVHKLSSLTWEFVQCSNATLSETCTSWKMSGSQPCWTLHKQCLYEEITQWKDPKTGKEVQNSKDVGFYGNALPIWLGGSDNDSGRTMAVAKAKKFVMHADACERYANFQIDKEGRTRTDRVKTGTLNVDGMGIDRYTTVTMTVKLGKVHTEIHGKRDGRDGIIVEDRKLSKTDLAQLNEAGQWNPDFKCNYPNIHGYHNSETCKGAEREEH